MTNIIPRVGRINLFCLSGYVLDSVIRHITYPTANKHTLVTASTLLALALHVPSINITIRLPSSHYCGAAPCLGLETPAAGDNGVNNMYQKAPLTTKNCALVMAYWR